ncbi:polysaccharide biosynthesis protein [Aeromonas caviae]|uniref:Nucleoside-diphosphate sugar epimerase/dehydratase n=1 Tax=Aeromonas caviae TaxID=648 RepID=A0AAF0GHX3_AERCA|nr:nucleoside-diphosphate sugar epimerase/dehydratase [Aeromonas caviae]WGC85818.1 nucleoside-diphosphate sugar epimerase/dehydratase [Aeromonas caviae]BBG90118.1 PII uridylyl-transferase [Aeromonas caviae]BBT53774.1 PII uridylyl-transferase [Aeromonas caviae]
MLTFFLGLSRPLKRSVSVLIDAMLLTVAFWGGYWVRLDMAIPIRSLHHWELLALLIPVTVFIFAKLGLYRAVLRYVGFKVLWTVSLGIFLSTLCLVTFSFFFEIFLPRTVSVIYFAFAILLIGGVRLFFRMLVNRGKGSRVPVLIYGAGSSGRQLELALNQGQEFFPVAFVDDAPHLRKALIQGNSVYSPDDIGELIMRFGVKKILLAIPSASRVVRQDVLRRLEPFPCEVLSIPGMADLVGGKAQINELKEVSIEDLLGRDPVAPIPELLNANITGKRVMVTGAGGSIGSELCRQIIRCKPEKLILFELSEYGLYAIDKELSDVCEHEGIDVDIVPLLGSVQRQNRLFTIMSNLRVQTVYHAAAYKHVPLVEYNVVEGVRNNIFGTLYCAQAAIESRVETFVLISTDKAVRPTNTMGATKRLAELILQALASAQNQTRFCMVRFGNVLGSSGSVVPLFRKQIRDGGPLTVTHPDIIRYFMTIPEASQLVIQAGAMGSGGDVFVLDMGQPVKIIELAYRMIRLSGLTLKNEQNPNGDIEVKITGLRPGEKLFEELLIGDNVLGTHHPRIMKANEQLLPWAELRALLLRIDAACHHFDHEQLRSLLLEAPAAFTPTDGICDLVWKARGELKPDLIRSSAIDIEFLNTEINHPVH